MRMNTPIGNTVVSIVVGMATWICVLPQLLVVFPTSLTLAPRHEETAVKTQPSLLFRMRELT